MTTVAAPGPTPPAPEGEAAPAQRRAARRTARHVFRPHRTWPAVLTALVLAGAAALAAVDAVALLAGRPLRLIPLDQAAALLGAWRAPAVVGAAAALCLLGLVLLGAALLPGKGRYVALRSDRPELCVGISRAALGRALAATAREVDGVSAARVRVRRRTVKVRADTALRAERTLPGRVAEAVRAHLDRLAPQRRMRVAAAVREGRG